MKPLQRVSLSRMSNLEFGQHAKSARASIIASGTINDPILQSYLTKTDAASALYERSMIQVAKSDKTTKVAHADMRRDLAIRAFLRYLTVFELSEEESERDAYESLDTLRQNYEGITEWNFEKETNGIDNLVAELETAKYGNHIARIGAEGLLTRMKNTNAEFKSLFESRNYDESIKEVFDVKQLRSALQAEYQDMSDYVLSMSKASGDGQFSKALTALNVVRKYYADMLAQRKPGKDGEEAAVIPAMK